MLQLLPLDQRTAIFEHLSLIPEDEVNVGDFNYWFFFWCLWSKSSMFACLCSSSTFCGSWLTLPWKYYLSWWLAFLVQSWLLFLHLLFLWFFSWRWWGHWLQWTEHNLLSFPHEGKCVILCHGALPDQKAMVVQKEYERYSYGSHDTKSCPHSCQS